MRAQRAEVETRRRDERRHALLPFMAGNAHAIDIRILDTGKRGDRLRDFRRRDILALPAEGVADAVDEIEIAARVLAHQVAGAEPRIALLEHVAQHLALARLLFRIAFEPVR